MGEIVNTFGKAVVFLIDWNGLVCAAAQAYM